MRARCSGCLEEVEIGDPDDTPGAQVPCSRCGAAIDPRHTDTLPPGTELPELAPGLRAGDALGGYVLERRLGKGGMGTVFLAKQLSLGREVALKIMAPELQESAEFVRRFDAEARALAALSHPNIVRVIDKGQDRGRLFLVMELVDGAPLRALLDERRLTPAQALAMVPPLCDALEYAHARGVIHRDVKPQNILVAKDGTPRIADFGLARIVGESDSERLTRSSVVMGTLDYMAPEQREKSKSADHRSDIYALGVVLYEMLTGELPLGRFDPPSKKVKLEVDIDEVVLRVLAQDPEVRYQRASDVGSEIRRRLAGEGRPAVAEAAPSTTEADARRGLSAAMALRAVAALTALGAWPPMMREHYLPLLLLAAAIAIGAQWVSAARARVGAALGRVAWTVDGLPAAIAIAGVVGLVALALPWTYDDPDHLRATPGIEFVQWLELVIAATCAAMLAMVRLGPGPLFAGTASLCGGLTIATLSALALAGGVWKRVGPDDKLHPEWASLPWNLERQLHEVMIGRGVGPDLTLLVGLALAVAGGVLLVIAPRAPERPGEPAMRGLARLGLALSAISIVAPVIVGVIDFIMRHRSPIEVPYDWLTSIGRAALAAMIVDAIAGIVCSVLGRTDARGAVASGRLGRNLGIAGLVLAIGIGVISLQL